MNVTFYPNQLGKNAPSWAVTPATLARVAVQWINSKHTDPRRKWRQYRVGLRLAKGVAR